MTYLILSYLILYSLRLVQSIRFLFLIYCKTKKSYHWTKLSFTIWTTKKCIKTEIKKKERRNRKKNREKHCPKHHDFRRFSASVSWQRQPQRYNRETKFTSNQPSRHRARSGQHRFQGVHNEIFFACQPDYGICLFQYKRHRSCLSSFPFGVTLILSSKSFSISAGGEGATRREREREEGWRDIEVRVRCRHMYGTVAASGERILISRWLMRIRMG